MHRPTPEYSTFDSGWLDELAAGCRGLRGTHPRFEDLFLDRRLEIRVARDEAVSSVWIEGAAARWRFPSRWAMRAAAGVSSNAVSALVSHYADRLDIPPSPPHPLENLDPPAGWVDSARNLAERGAVVRFMNRRSVVIRRDGWVFVGAPPLVRIELASHGRPALLAVSGHPQLGEWVRKLLEPPPTRPWSPPGGFSGPVLLTEGTAGVLLHELVGHLVEGDLVAAGRSPLAGLGGASLSEATIDLVDNPLRFDLPGGFGADDEGVPAEPVTLLRAGRLCGLLCNRETAEICEVAPGRGRRSDWRHPPIPRLSNLVVAAGSASPESMESDLRSGLVITRLAGATVDPVSSRAVLRVERGYEVRNGRRRRPLGRCELTGGVTEILAGLDPTVGNDPTPDWRLGWCVKDGAPLPTGSETPTMLIRRLEVL